MPSYFIFADDFVPLTQRQRMISAGVLAGTYAIVGGAVSYCTGTLLGNFSISSSIGISHVAKESVGVSLGAISATALSYKMLQGFNKSNRFKWI
jgi:type IV secretory pathway protease TraF